MDVTILGGGYVGLVTGAGLAELGHRVTVVEPNPARRGALAAGRLPIYEPGLDVLVQRAQSRGLLVPAAAWNPGQPADLILLAVGTPARPDGTADLSQVKAALEQIRSGLAATTCSNQPPLVVIRSTVPPGTTRWAALQLEGLAPVAHNPEFLAEGTAVRNFFYPDRLVLEVCNPADAHRLLDLYRPLLEQRFCVPLPDGDLRGSGRPVPVQVTSPEESELIKLGANAMLATRISLINELARLCETCGARIAEVAQGIGMDPRIGPAFLRVGVGWGGSCFGKDLQALTAAAAERGIHLSIPVAAYQANQEQRRWFAAKVCRVLGGLRGRQIAVLGLAFKLGTDDLRDAPALDLIRTFLAGGATVTAHDPLAVDRCRTEFPHLPVRYAQTPLEAARGAQGLVLVTEWPEYAALDWTALRQVMARPLLIDGRNFLDPAACRQAGFTYLGVGVPEPPGEGSSE